MMKLCTLSELHNIISKEGAMEKDRYTLYIDDKPVLRLNLALIKKQDCLENVSAILEKHRERLEIHVAMMETSDSTLLQLYDQMYTDVEFELQDLWKFERNANFHRFWERPKCGCPRMDNMDWYPYKSVISGGCKVHSYQISER